MAELPLEIFSSYHFLSGCTWKDNVLVLQLLGRDTSNRRQMLTTITSDRTESSRHCGVPCSISPVQCSKPFVSSASVCGSVEGVAGRLRRRPEHLCFHYHLLLRWLIHLWTLLLANVNRLCSCRSLILRSVYLLRPSVNLQQVYVHLYLLYASDPPVRSK